MELTPLSYSLSPEEYGYVPIPSECKNCLFGGCCSRIASRHEGAYCRNRLVKEDWLKKWNRRR